ncbi:helix-turn-helix transcriptional regulator [Chromobacterium vaccinii]|uniref:winged helix-turn-helix transcriptional regulator n=1 Tax=Chromobacterium vaccinii TaxID=1108595 RepID=UPI001E30118A|nr:helix-turn-helix domain-containing protein [Chromobacterium vaccinii]MCD4484020.1 helix-turn-helix transcriptional regulator [Chromobacterium vaccinii]
MSRRKTLSDSPCPVARAVDIIGDRWSLLIIRDAFDGLRRFGEFQSNLGMAKNILADRLKMLTENGIIQMVPASDGTAYQEYVLTRKGEGLFPIIVMYRQWGECNLYKSDENHSSLIYKHNRQPVGAIHLATENGAKLQKDDTTVKKIA